MRRLHAARDQFGRRRRNRKDEIVLDSTGLYRGDLVVFNTTIDVPG
ncbi:hypothetical protein [Rhodopseudomonas telluris]|uniref:Transposase n=1 Tax=Rhodopseudomonas telluris TaxID=644215 RepID=A0ABV6EMT3_9BRAD